VWLVYLLSNQGVLIHNKLNPEKQKSLLTEEDIELFTSPLELFTYKDAIMSAMLKGTKLNVESDEERKNA
jgi:hypothetical protein